MSPIGDALARNPILRDLPAEARAAIEAQLEHMQVPAGVRVVRQGEGDRTMYFLLAGEARAVRGGVEVARIVPGEHFGEIGLVVGRPRAASVETVTPVEMARLTHERYRTLGRTHPDAALALLEAIVAGVGERLTEVTDNMGVLLVERALPRRARVAVRVMNDVRQVPTGALVASLLPPEVRGHPVVAGLIDRKPVSLGQRITSDCELEPLTTASAEGQRIQRRAVALLLLEAARRVAPTVDVRIGHSLGFGQRVMLNGSHGMVGLIGSMTELARGIEAQLERLVDEDVPLREELWTVDEARDHFAEMGWTDAAELLRTWTAAAVPMVSFGEVYAIALEPAAPRAGMLRGARLVVDGEHLLLLYPPMAAARPADDQAVQAARIVSKQAQGMTGPQERWLDTLGITSVGAFNRACVRGSVPDLIRVAEGFHEKRLSSIADAIAARQARSPVVAIAGPSSSGKTTFLKRLRVQLQVNGIAPRELSLDDYYCDRELTPLDASGEYDFESFDALRVDLLADHLSRLSRGERLKTARYDFKTGRSHPDGGPEMELGPGSVLMLEGIHGLNPRLFELVPGASVFRVFVCPLAQLPFDRISRVHASDVRLLRRIVRDRHGRNLDASTNIHRWTSVRAGERKHIFPHQHLADAIFDTSLIYEMSVLKVYAERYLLEVPPEHPSHTTSYRLLQLLERFVTIYPDQVPPTSILREFIGGGGFEY